MKEILKLIELLAKNNIPFELNVLFDAPQVIYPNKDLCVCDVICHKYCYGYEQGLLEMMGLCPEADDNVVGYLTADEVFEKIKSHYTLN